MTIIKGHDTMGYGESAVNIQYPDSYSKDCSVTLLCNGKRLGKIVLHELGQLARLTEALGDDFRIIPSSWARKYRV